MAAIKGINAEELVSVMQTMYDRIADETPEDATQTIMDTVKILKKMIDSVSPKLRTTTPLEKRNETKTTINDIINNMYNLYNNSKDYMEVNELNNMLLTDIKEIVVNMIRMTTQVLEVIEGFPLTKRYERGSIAADVIYYEIYPNEKLYNNSPINVEIKTEVVPDNPEAVLIGTTVYKYKDGIYYTTDHTGEYPISYDSIIQLETERIKDYEREQRMINAAYAAGFFIDDTNYLVKGLDNATFTYIRNPRLGEDKWWRFVKQNGRYYRYSGGTMTPVDINMALINIFMNEYGKNDEAVNYSLYSDIGTGKPLMNLHTTKQSDFGPKYAALLDRGKELKTIIDNKKEKIKYMKHIIKKLNEAKKGRTIEADKLIAQLAGLLNELDDLQKEKKAIEEELAGIRQATQGPVFNSYRQSVNKLLRGNYSNFVEYNANIHEAKRGIAPTRATVLEAKNGNAPTNTANKTRKNEASSRKRSARILREMGYFNNNSPNVLSTNILEAKSGIAPTNVAHETKSGNSPTTVANIHEAKSGRAPTNTTRKGVSSARRRRERMLHQLGFFNNTGKLNKMTQKEKREFLQSQVQKEIIDARRSKKKNSHTKKK